MAIAATALLLLTVIIMCSGSMSGPAAAGRYAVAAEIVPSGQDVALPVATFADGRARFYRYVTTTGRETRFFVIKTADGVIRTAFDACNSCYRDRRGFRETGDHLICNSCGKALWSQHVNVLNGGCNPLPLERTIQGDRITLRAAALEQGNAYF